MGYMMVGVLEILFVVPVVGIEVVAAGIGAAVAAGIVAAVADDK